MRSLVNNVRHLLRVWLATTRASIIREMEFRGNFIAGLIRQGLWLGVFVFLIEVIFSNVTALSGWAKYEVLIIIALSRIIEGIMNVLFVSNIMELPERVRQGLFDWHLVRPLPAQFATAFRRTNIEGIGNVLGGVVVMLYAVSQLEVAITIRAVSILLLLSIMGITIYYALLLIIATLVFVLDRLEFLWGFNILLSEPLTVPFDIFPRLPRQALTYIIPLAFVVFVPAQAITGRLVWWQIPLGVVTAGLLLLLANLAWRAGLRRYSSASS